MKKILLIAVSLGAFFSLLYFGAQFFAPNSSMPSASTSFVQKIKSMFVKPEMKPSAIPPFDMPIKLPAGFKMYIYAKVPNARSMALGEDGTVYVGNKTGKGVYALPDKNNDGIVDRVVTIASNLTQPNGIAVKNNALYVSDNTSVLKYDNISNALDNPVFNVIRDGFIPAAYHQWKYTAFGPDGKLYVALGAPCDTCEPQEPYGTIARMNDDGTGLEVVATGIRNSVGFDWHPQTGELWFTDNGRDNMGDDVPPDELNRISSQREHFGFPYCFGTDVADPVYGLKKSCSEFTPPEVNLDPHAAALGMKFYRGSMFPEEYNNVIFIAQHGSWNRKEKIGYRILTVKQGTYGYTVTPFAEGWLRPDGSVIGRPVDIIELKDGSLLISDDASGLVYRVIYNP